MKNYFVGLKAKKQIILIGLFIIPTWYMNKVTNPPTINISMEDSALNISSGFIQYFNVGNKRLFSAFLWIKTLLDADHEHYKKRDKNSWMYLRFNTMSLLDPKFLEVYQFGGLYLSVIKDDIEGASAIYKKGLSEFPDDYKLNFFGATHFYFEENNPEVSLKHFKKIQYHPHAPKYLPSLVSRIVANQGRLENSFLLLFDAYKKTDLPHLKTRMKLNLYALRAEIDLNCLNNGKDLNKCNRNDFEGDPYLKTAEGTWRAARKWKKFRPSNPRK